MQRADVSLTALGVDATQLRAKRDLCLGSLTMLSSKLLLILLVAEGGIEPPTYGL
jgi:hypothetical protein